MENECGVGCQMAQLIPKWMTDQKRIEEKGGCTCKKMAMNMDKNGIEWCENNIPRLVNYFLQQDKHLKFGLASLPRAAKEAAIKMWLSKAIRRAKDAKK